MKPTVCVASDKGPREEQQDAVDIFSLEGRMLVVVCDGAGGHRGGAEAARTVVAVAGDTFQKLGGKFENPEKSLKSICLAAHREIQQIRESPKLAPRSTVAMLYIDGKKSCWAHVGDSRIYHLKGKILERSRDHTMVQILHEQGEVSEEEMGTHPDQGRLLRALGAEDEPRASFGHAEIGAKDAFFLCTDGLWERIKTSEIEELIRRGPSQANLKALVSEAMERNGPKGDNVSAAAVWCGGGKPRRSNFTLLAIALSLIILITLAVVLLPRLLQARSDATTAPSPAQDSAPPAEVRADSQADLEEHGQEDQPGDDGIELASDQPAAATPDSIPIPDENIDPAQDIPLPLQREGDPMLDGTAIDEPLEVESSQDQTTNNQP